MEEEEIAKDMEQPPGVMGGGGGGGIKAKHEYEERAYKFLITVFLLLVSPTKHNLINISCPQFTISEYAIGIL